MVGVAELPGGLMARLLCTSPFLSLEHILNNNNNSEKLNFIC